MTEAERTVHRKNKGVVRCRIQRDAIRSGEPARAGRTIICRSRRSGNVRIAM